MTDKLYGLDDIPEGCTVSLHKQVVRGVAIYGCVLGKDGETSQWEIEPTPQLALHKAIQKARGEND